MVRTLQVMAEPVNRNGVTRAQAAADAIASARAEGLEPIDAEVLLAAWAKGDLTDSQLEEARLRLLNEPSLTATELLSRAHAA
jgi:hypothetical protein